jgi:hypothetical protein
MPRVNRQTPEQTIARNERLVLRQRAVERRHRAALYIDRVQSEATRAAVQRYRDEKAKRVLAGKPVLKSVEEWRGECVW